MKARLSKITTYDPDISRSLMDTLRRTVTGHKLALPLVFQRRDGIWLRNFDNSVAVVEMADLKRLVEGTRLGALLKFFEELQITGHVQSVKEAKAEIMSESCFFSRIRNDCRQNPALLERLAKFYVAYSDFDHQRSAVADHDLATLLNFISFDFGFSYAAERDGKKWLVSLQSNYDVYKTHPFIEEVRKKESYPVICAAYAELSALVGISAPYGDLETLVGSRLPHGQKIYMEASGQSSQTLNRLAPFPYRADVKLISLKWLEGAEVRPDFMRELGDYRPTYYLPDLSVVELN